MMNVTEITARLYAINDALITRTGKRVTWGGLDLRIKDDGCEVRLHTEYTTAPGWDHGTARGDTPEAALDEADRIIAAMPDLDAAKLHQHMVRLADCADKARDDGIADEYVQPIRMTVAAITANLLPAPEAGQ